MHVSPRPYAANTGSFWQRQRQGFYHYLRQFCQSTDRALLQAAALRLPDRTLAFTGVINGSACSFASRTILSRLVFASRADFSVLMICCAARAVTSLFFSPLVGFGMKTPSGIWCRIICSYKRKRPGFPDLPQFASMASASTSVVKDQKRFP
jgi:hypothetical protein